MTVAVLSLGVTAKADAQSLKNQLIGSWSIVRNCEEFQAGIEVRRYEVKPDGGIMIETGKPEATEADNPWLAEIKRQTKH
jgi:hypothetical protein